MGAWAGRRASSPSGASLLPGAAGPGQGIGLLGCIHPRFRREWASDCGGARAPLLCVVRPFLPFAPAPGLELPLSLGSLVHLWLERAELGLGALGS